MPNQPQHQTSPLRVIMAFTLGPALAGGIISIGAALSHWAMAVMGFGGGLSRPFLDYLHIGNMWQNIALLWFFGQLLLVSIPWFWMHLEGRTHWKYAVFAGAIAALLAALLVPNLKGVEYVPIPALVLFFGLSGFVIWRIAYGQIGKPWPPSAGAYETTDGRVNAAIILGAAAAGLLFSAYILGAAKMNGGEALPPDTFALSIYLAFPVALVWLFGLCTLGAACWWVMHRAGLRHWLHALVLGASLVPLVLFTAGEHGLGALALYAMWGAAVGWVIWRIAYFKIEAPTAGP